MSDLQKLLAELNEIAPQICQKDRYLYIIGEYAFFISNDKFQARQSGFFEINPIVTGLPAYDWLQGALMRVIREQGMYWELRYSKPRNRYQAEIANHTVWNNDATEALLIAFITALKGE